MDNKQKQRVIGIIFLVVLAVVAIPAFLKRSGTSEVISPTSEEALNSQSSPSALPAEPLTESSQPASALPLEAAPQQPNVPNQTAMGEEQQPIPDTTVTPPPVAAPIPAQPQPSTAPSQAIMQEESQEPMPNESQALPGITTPSQNPVVSAPAEPAKQSQPLVKKASPTKPHKSIVKNNTQGPKSDWVIRLAILSVRANADKLIKDMKKHGYTGQVEEINTYKGMTYKVTLKTHSSRAEAEQLGQKLNKLFHINVIVNKAQL